MKKRILTNDSEFDRVLGGGIVPGCNFNCWRTWNWKINTVASSFIKN